MPKDPARWQRLAAHLRQHPGGFAIALENLDRWEQWGRAHTGPIREWRRRIQQAQSSETAMSTFLSWLAAGNEDSEPLKSCSPFVGVMPDPKPADV